MGIFKLVKMTASSVFKKPETCCYPVQTKTAYAGLRGHVEIDAPKCFLCGVCEKRCPSGAIKVLKNENLWQIDHFRCVQCESCVHECHKGALSMAASYEPVSPNKTVERVEVDTTPPKPKKAEDTVKPS